MATGIPEPYGENCDMAYGYVSKAVNQIRTDAQIRKHIRAGSELMLGKRVEAGEIDTAKAKSLKEEHEQKAKARIQEILNERVLMANEKMLGILAPAEAKKRRWMATGVATIILLIFIFLFRYIFRVFHEQA